MVQCSGATRFILIIIYGSISLASCDTTPEPINLKERHNEDRLLTKREAPPPPAIQPPKPNPVVAPLEHRHLLKFNTSGVGASNNNSRRIVAQQKPLEINPKTLQLIGQAGAEKLSGQLPSPECLEDLGQFISIPDRDVPGWGDERDFESPTIGQCARSAYEASVMFAVWSDGRCFFKRVVKPSWVRLMTSDGIDLGNYDVPGWDVDSPVEFSGAMRWFDQETKSCDLVAKEGQQFWCKRFAHSPGKVLLFRHEEANEMDADLIETIDDTSGYLEKFWPISHRDRPHDDKRQFPSPDPRSCAKSAWQDGERLAIYRAGTCYYKNTQDGAELFNRHGQHVGNYDLWFSDIDKTTSEETKNGWFRDGKCDLVARTEKEPGNVEFWCKGYAQVEHCHMLFRKD